MAALHRHDGHGVAGQLGEVLVQEYLCNSTHFHVLIV